MTKILALLKTEPALVLGAICGLAMWSLTRYTSVDPSTAHQIVYGVLPVLFAAITRQFVSPVASSKPSTEPSSNLATFDPGQALGNINAAAKTTTVTPQGTPTGNFVTGGEPNEVDHIEPLPPLIVD